MRSFLCDNFRNWQHLNYNLGQNGKKNNIKTQFIKIFKKKQKITLYSFDLIRLDKY
jgi:hypothetical protein